MDHLAHLIFTNAMTYWYDLLVFQVSLSLRVLKTYCVCQAMPFVFHQTMHLGQWDPANYNFSLW